MAHVWPQHPCHGVPKRRNLTAHFELVVNTVMGPHGFRNMPQLASTIAFHHASCLQLAEYTKYASAVHDVKQWACLTSTVWWLWTANKVGSLRDCSSDLGNLHLQSIWQ